MITDSLLLLESSRTDVRAAATYVSGNTIDLSVARDIGAGAQPLKCLWNVEAAYAGGTSIQFQQIISANANLSSPDVVDNGVIVPLANLVINALIVRYVPELLGGATTGATGAGGVGITGKRYFGAQEVSLGTMTAGTHSCRLVVDVIDVKHYPGAFVIL